jgi:RNA polymerase sigma-70 factor (ECF subfamily)
MYKSNRRREWLRSRLRLEKSPADNPIIAGDESGRIAARIWLKKAFRAISAEEKALITLFELEGLSVAELADMYGKPEGTIKSRLSRARKKMREELKSYLTKSNLTKVEAEYALPGSKTALK